MESAYGYALERSRSEKIKALGFLCYNLYIDGIIISSEIYNMVVSIKESINYVLLLRKNITNEAYFKWQEAELNDKLFELGCFCYNLYVDRRLVNNNMLALCTSITEVSRRIADARAYNCSYGESSHNEDYSNRNIKQKLKVNCPYGMELIPANYKKCMCGYRNRPEARFCAKCGVKIGA